jgi:hypothetical protein
MWQPPHVSGSYSQESLGFSLYRTMYSVGASQFPIVYVYTVRLGSYVMGYVFVKSPLRYEFTSTSWNCHP